MTEPSNMDKISEHRARIDEIDRKLVELLNERAVNSLKIRKLKPGANMKLYDPHREDEILQKVCRFSEGPLQDEHLREVYATILKVMKETPSL